MRRENAEVSLVPSFLKGRGGLVNLGRWAGIFVIANAFFPGAREAFGFYSEGMTPLQHRVLFFLSTLVSRGSSGVIIILLAELVDALRREDSDYDEAGNDDEDSAERQT